MSTNGITEALQPQASGANQYDHRISLIDATKRAGTTRAGPPQDVASASGSSSPKASGVPLSRRPTRATLREELAKRKYSKWQEGRYDNLGDGEGSSDGSPDESTGTKVISIDVKTSPPPMDEVQANDASRAPKQPFPSEATKKGRHSRGIEEKGESAIDVLYENQRGLFWCGIPLYSHKSLLNFDPSPWQTASFKDSPVNITNAQVPDPSWEWAWKSWYVDMSQDVDEEGWQYSFSFTRGFAWHGTHPWFHSFCRRRRWLRKKTRKQLGSRRGVRDATSQAHVLSADYFVIDSPTRESSIERAGHARSSYSSQQGDGTEDEEGLDDVRDINALMRALKRSPVDRVKIDVVKQFLLQGGEDVFYLADRMPNIMTSLVFQNSRRQLLAFLIHACEAASEHQSKHFGKETLEEDLQERRVRSLSDAVRAAEAQVKGLEYWSDVKNVAGSEEGSEAADQVQGVSPVEGEGSNIQDGTKMAMSRSKGIPDKADKVKVQVAGKDVGDRSKENERSGGLDKGKRRE